MVLSTASALHAVIWPHDLLDSIWKRDWLEECAAWVVRLERDMVLRVPVSREEHMLVARFVTRICSDLGDDAENCLIVWHTE